ncbi:hypothetical protein CISG_08460 [Coccidioides immitis RMSCC 3703]|uniref:Uncharacterized protein n=1 Tax=Coccidioides immitis RMSCC 3703 TaxID=454286 RepID=A0A0J8R4U2_COCIT|nr:hypothetical protein CISG_08460 [Coccidioides immitis RMSCC 3703]
MKEDGEKEGELCEEVIDYALRPNLLRQPGIVGVQSRCPLVARRPRERQVNQ